MVVLGAEWCGGIHGALRGSGLVFGLGVQCRPADSDWIKLFRPSIHTHTHKHEVLVKSAILSPPDLALWYRMPGDTSLKGTLSFF